MSMSITIYEGELDRGEMRGEEREGEKKVRDEARAK